VTEQVKKIGLERALREIPLLADSSGSGGWEEWHQLAGLQYRPMQNRLVIPDSNDRVQAVIDGQGIALWDDLVQNELDSGELFFVSELAIETAGYYLSSSSPVSERSTAAETFIKWIQQQNVLPHRQVTDYTGDIGYISQHLGESKCPGRRVT